MASDPDMWFAGAAIVLVFVGLLCADRIETARGARETAQAGTGIRSDRERTRAWLRTWASRRGAAVVESAWRCLASVVGVSVELQDREDALPVMHLHVPGTSRARTYPLLVLSDSQLDDALRPLAELASELRRRGASPYR